MGVEIVHDQAHFGRLRVALIEHAFDEVGPVPAGALGAQFDMTAAGQRFDFDEDRGHAVTNVFVIEDVAGMGAATSPTSCLFDSSMHTTGSRGSYGKAYTASTSSMLATKAALPSGGIFQYLLR